MLKIRLLGQFDLRLDRKKLTIPSRIGQSLFAYLAMTAGTSHRREKLAGIFWSDTTDENSRKHLRQELWRIRKVISSQKSTTKEYVLADEFSLAFNRDSEYWLDVSQMEPSNLDLQSLITNLSLYQGELLPGFYDDWIVLERERIQSIFDARMDQLLEHLVMSESWIAVQEWGERWLAFSGVREPAYRALMLASGVRGDMARVASLFQRCADELMENLGVEPSAETRALNEGLLKGSKMTSQSSQKVSLGTITFLFLDIEGSADLLSTLGEQYASALNDYLNIIRTALEKWKGHEVEAHGDSFFANFPSALDAVQCAAEMQHSFTDQTWPQGETIRVRMGLHSGESLIQSPEFVGLDVHRAARIGDAGHGGQILLSQTTRELVIDDLPSSIMIRDLGDQHLKDIKSPTTIYQLVVDGLQSEFMGLRSNFTGQEAPLPGNPPFKGLQYFDEADADLFFGRELITAKLVDQLCNGQSLSVIIGASGSGKSSIVRAGLVPAIKRGEIHFNGTSPAKNSANWQVQVITPTARPIEVLAAKLTQESETVTATATLSDDLTQDPRSLSLFLKRLNNKQTTVLVVDQFEELFTLCRDAFEREAFIDNLLTALDSMDGRFILIITLRADFYSHLSQYPELRDLAAQRQEYIGPMTSEELHRAIEEPARRGQWDFETGLIDLILRDIGEEPGGLPLLSHGLLETWKRRARNTLTLKGYEDAGGVHGAIAQTAETVYQSFPPTDQTIVRDIFVRLTEFGQGTDDTRRRASFGELISHERDSERTTAVLRKLAEARLVTLSEDSAEVAHEALIREWPKLREWLSQDRAGIILHRHLTEATRDWELLELDPGALYRGARLAQANEWEEQNPLALNDQEKRFLDSSNQQAMREQLEREEARERELAAAKELAETQSRAAARLRRRNRVITIIGLIALVFGALAMMFSSRANQNAEEANLNLWQAQTAEALAVEEQDRADEERDNALTAQAIARSRELAAAALNTLTDDAELSSLLALEGLKLAQTREAEEALHQAIMRLRVKQSLPHLDWVGAVAFSPDGKLLVTGSDDGLARVWNVDTGQEEFSLSGHTNWINAVDISPGGRLIATASSDETVKIWDINTQNILTTLASHSDLVARVVFSPDGKRLATSGWDGAVRVWDVPAWQEEHTFSGFATGRTNSLAFSPDGTRLAITTLDELSIWDLSSGENLLTISEDGVEGVDFSPDGKQLVVGIEENISILNAETGQDLLQLVGHTALIQYVRFSPDGKQIVSFSLDDTVRIWDSSSGRELLILAQAESIWNVKFSQDGTLVATGGDKIARIWDTSPGGSKEVLTLTGRKFRNVNYSPDDKLIITASQEDGVVQVWDAKSGMELLRLDAHEDIVHQAVFSADGTRIATSSADYTAKIWDTETGQQLLSISGHDEGFTGSFYGVMDIAFSPDGSRIATAGSDGVAKIWDAYTGDEILTLSGNEIGALTRIRFSPDGRLIATGHSRWTDDSAYWAEARIWDANTGEELHVLTVPGQLLLWGIAFDPAGERLITSGNFGFVKIWDVETGRELMDIPDFEGTASNVSFSPDGSRVGIVGGDGLHIWDLEENRKLLELHSHSSFVTGLSFANDFSQVATSSLDGTVQVIYLNVDDLITLAESRLTRSLTTAECQQYLRVDSCPAQP